MTEKEIIEYFKQKGANVICENDTIREIAFYHIELSRADLVLLKTALGIIIFSAYYCNLYDNDLKIICQLKSIETLCLYSNRGITNESIKYIDLLPNLKWLGIIDTGITNNGIESLIKSKPDLLVSPEKF